MKKILNSKFNILNSRSATAGVPRSVKNSIVPKFFSLNKIKLFLDRIYSMSNMRLGGHKKTMPFSTAGFGIIELLITLAVVGILVTMLTSNLGVVSDRKSDPKIKAVLLSAGSAARAYYINQDPFGFRGLCGDLSNDGVTNDFSRIIQDLVQGGAGKIACAATDTEYAVAIDFTKEGGESDIFCLDNRGFAGKITEGGIDIVRIGRCQR